MVETDNKVEILGRDWQLVPLVPQYFYDIQNVSNVQLEWSYSNTTDVGQKLNPQEIAEDINKPVYFRVVNASIHGAISALRKTNGGNTESVRIVDASGKSNLIGLEGEQLAADMINYALGNFEYGISTRELSGLSEVNGGTVSVTGGNLLTVSSGSNPAGSATVQSLGFIRLRNGHTGLAQFTALFESPTLVDCHQYIGVFDEGDQNGYTVCFINGQLAVSILKDGVHSHIFQASFNGDIDPNSIDFTKLNKYRIIFGDSVEPVIFEIREEGSMRYRTLHTIYSQNKQTLTNITAPYLPLRVLVVNQGNTTPAVIKTTGWQAGAIGICTTCGTRGFSYPTTPGTNAIKTGVGTTAVPLATFKNKTTFNGILNKIRAQLNRISFVPFNPSELTATTVVTVQLVGGATIANAVYADLDASNSVIQVNTNAATTVTGGKVALTLMATIAPSQGNVAVQSTAKDLDAEAMNLFLDPSQEFAIIAFTNTGTVSLAWTTSHLELF